MMIPHEVLAKLGRASRAKPDHQVVHIPYIQPARRFPLPLDERPEAILGRRVWYAFRLQEWGTRGGRTLWTWRFPDGHQEEEELAKHIMRETGVEEIVVKSVGMSSFGTEQVSHGRIDIEAEDGRYFRGLSAIGRRPPVAGERVRVWPGGFEIVGRDRGFTDDVWEADRPR